MESKIEIPANEEHTQKGKRKKNHYAKCFATQKILLYTCNTFYPREMADLRFDMTEKKNTELREFHLIETENLCETLKEAFGRSCRSG